MRKTKKALLLLMSFIMVLSMFAGISISSHAVTHMYYDFNEDGVTITQVNTHLSGEVVVPEEIEGYPVTEIGDGAFKDCIYITSVIIPDSVKRIGFDAFAYTYDINHLTIGSGVESIDEYAFRYCFGLEFISVSEDNEYYCNDENGVLFNKAKTKLVKYPSRSDIEEYEIPVGVSEIGYGAFYKSINLKNVTIPDSVTTLQGDVFSECNVLEYVYIPGSIAHIGDYFLSSCSNLKKVELGEGVQTIGVCAFSDCYSLAEVSIPDSLTVIDAFAFLNCKQLTGIYLPEGLTTLGKQAFYFCGSLRNITLPSTLEIIGEACFVGCPIREINLPLSIKELEQEAFSGTDLQTVTIPGSVETILPNTFVACDNLERVIISEGVTSILSSSFKSCENLKTVVIPESVRSISDIAIGMFEFNPREFKEYLVNGDEITIYGVPGSYAEEFAKDMGMNFDDIENLPDDSAEKVAGEYNGFSYELKNNKIKIMSVDENISGKVIIPAEIESYPVTEIESYAFFHNDSITEIVIPDTVTIIEDRAIFCCENLKKITVPESVTSIEKFALGGNYYKSELSHVLNVEICGTPGSAAETYADDNDISFIDAANPPEETTKPEPTTKPSEPTTKPTEPTTKPVSDKLAVSGDKIKVNEAAKTVEIGQKNTAESVSEIITNNKYVIFGKDGKELGRSDLVGTGSTVGIVDDYGNVISEYIFVVPTDVDGNGKTTAADARLALRGSAKLENITGVYAMASDVTDDGKITAADARKILRISAGLEK